MIGGIASDRVASSDTAPTDSVGPRAQLKEVAQQFEAIFLRQMLATARSDDLGGDDLFGSSGEDTFREMRDARFAEIASQSGNIGLAASLEAQLARFVQSGS